MPELPEVETTRRGVEPWVTGRSISEIRVHQTSLRWPVECPPSLVGATIRGVLRRGKYLLFRFDAGTLIVHLGMSGSLRIMPEDAERLKHDHFELIFQHGSATKSLRLNDPRRFGCVLFQPGSDPESHALLNRLGVEPLGNEFSGEGLFQLSRNRKVAVKNFIMDSKVVVGVGNIYAAESLFLAGIRPTVPAGRVSKVGYEHLSRAIRRVLTDAVTQGGTTLRDFVGSDGQPGYFKQSLYVYGREKEPCKLCNSTLRMLNIGNRSSVFCPQCQRRSGFVPPIEY